MGRRGIARDHDRLHLERAQIGDVFSGLADDRFGRLIAVGHAGGVSEIKDVLLRQQPAHRLHHGEAAHPGIKGADGPIGALGVPLTSERSIAVDPASIPLGTPVFLSTTRPMTTQPLNRLVFAQDVGSAIKGTVRADYFWGFGDDAGDLAGHMKQRGRMWLLLPNS